MKLIKLNRFGNIYVNPNAISAIRDHLLFFIGETRGIEVEESAEEIATLIEKTEKAEHCKQCPRMLFRRIKK